jgi:hypothetical protein
MCEGYPDAERWINLHQNDMVKIQNIKLFIYLFIRRLEVIMAGFPKTIKFGLALTVFGSAFLAIQNQTDFLSDTVYNLIFGSILGFGSILFIYGSCKGDTP